MARGPGVIWSDPAGHWARLDPSFYPRSRDLNGDEDLPVPGDNWVLGERGTDMAKWLPFCLTWPTGTEP